MSYKQGDHMSYPPNAFPCLLPPAVSAVVEAMFTPGMYRILAMQSVPRENSYTNGNDAAVWVLTTHCKEDPGAAEFMLFLSKWIFPGKRIQVQVTEYVVISMLPTGEFVVRPEREVPNDSQLAIQLAASIMAAHII